MNALYALAISAMGMLAACEPDPPAVMRQDGGPDRDVTLARDANTAADAREARDATATPDVLTQDSAAPVDAAVGDRYAMARIDCVAEINRYRAMLSLAPYERWVEGEACADRMADFDAMTGQPHNGFNMSICSPRGNGQNECPRYGGPDQLNGCLGQMWAEGPSPTGEWDLAHGHYLNMVGDYTYSGNRVRFTRVACGFSAGGWMLQNFQ
ncbi:MAG: hypothetical protein Q8Q09_09045 [Deltaproteobacteria bacterium]|nr:hypothetical protein [Deltaproteobacteria bacterium]